MPRPGMPGGLGMLGRPGFRPLFPSLRASPPMNPRSDSDSESSKSESEKSTPASSERRGGRPAAKADSEEHDGPRARHPPQNGSDSDSSQCCAERLQRLLADRPSKVAAASSSLDIGAICGSMSLQSPARPKFRGFGNAIGPALAPRLLGAANVRIQEGGSPATLRRPPNESSDSGSSKHSAGKPARATIENPSRATAGTSTSDAVAPGGSTSSKAPSRAKLQGLGSAPRPFLAPALFGPPGAGTQGNDEPGEAGEASSDSSSRSVASAPDDAA